MIDFGVINLDSKTMHPRTEGYRLFSAVHGTFTKSVHIYRTIKQGLDTLYSYRESILALRLETSFKERTTRKSLNVLK